MKMVVQPYLFFEGRCEEALEFYTKALGAKVEAKMRYSDCPDSGGACPPGMPAGTEKKIMHAAFKLGDDVIMASDGMNSGSANFSGITLSISADDEAGVKKYFEALSQGGKVVAPLAKTFFSPAFGMVTDKFGVPWMVLVNKN
jgi:PhnB protein